MKKTLILIASFFTFNGLFAQEMPKWVKKARKAVFSVITYNEDNKILNTGNGFYIDDKGVGISDYSLFKGAHKASVITADGKELPVTLILGADDMYDVVRFKTAIEKKQEFLIPASTKGEKGQAVYILPYSTQNSVNLSKGSIMKVDSISNNSSYYTLDMKTAMKEVSCPLVNTNGEVIGIIQHNAGEEATESYALGVDFAKGLQINALSGSDATLKSIKIKKGLPEDESQAQVFLYMMASQLEPKEYLEILNDFITMFPNNMEGYLRKATYYMTEEGENSVKEVENNLKEMAEVAEKKEEAHYNTAKLIYSYCIGKKKEELKADWNLDRALKEINSALSIAQEGIYYQLQGDIYFAMQKYAEASASYEKLCKSAMTSAEAYYLAAKAKELTEGSDIKEVIALLDSAMTFYKEPYGKESAPYLYERGRIKDNAKMYREAVIDYNNFYDAMMGQVSAEFYLIRQAAEMQCRMYQQAINDINKAVEMEPNNAEYLSEKGGIHIRLNQIEEAVSALKKAISIDKNNAGAYRMLGYCQIKDKNTYKEGLDNLKKAEELGDKVATDLIKKYSK